MAGCTTQPLRHCYHVYSIAPYEFEEYSGTSDSCSCDMFDNKQAKPAFEKLQSLDFIFVHARRILVTDAINGLQLSSLFHRVDQSSERVEQREKDRDIR